MNWDSTAMNPETDRDPGVVGQVTIIGSTPPTSFEAAGQASRNWPLTWHVPGLQRIIKAHLPFQRGAFDRNRCDVVGNEVNGTNVLKISDDVSLTVLIIAEADNRADFDVHRPEVVHD
jgi:hypothetical protein